LLSAPCRSCSRGGTRRLAECCACRPVDSCGDERCADRRRPAVFPSPVPWDARWIRWPDFRLPADRVDAKDALREAWHRAAAERVEGVCGGPDPVEAPRWSAAFGVSGRGPTWVKCSSSPVPGCQRTTPGRVRCVPGSCAPAVARAQVKGPPPRPARTSTPHARRLAAVSSSVSTCAIRLPAATRSTSRTPRRSVVPPCRTRGATQLSAPQHRQHCGPRGFSGLRREQPKDVSFGPGLPLAPYGAWRTSSSRARSGPRTSVAPTASSPYRRARSSAAAGTAANEAPPRWHSAPQASGACAPVDSSDQSGTGVVRR
jgi:hypothetical protein